MGIISRFEAVMQGLVEGSFGRVFRTKLQPDELASKLTRAMEADLQISSDRRIAPNVYDIYLGQRDYDSLEGTFDSLQRRLANSLIAVARTRTYTLTTIPLLRFHLDTGIITGQPRIETQTVDPRKLPSQQAIGAVPVDETRALTAEEARELARQRAQSPQETLPPAWLTLYRPTRGQPLQITKPVLHIGRHLTNDVVVNDKRVSRHHAEIRYEHGQFVLYDLGSTNGVGINGVLTHQPVPLKNNDIISVGSHDFVFQRR